MPTISKITAREILDSRGEPTIETTVILSDETIAHSAVPAGASKGKYEAHELRDGDPDRFAGKGVLKAIQSVTETIAPQIVGLDVFAQQKIDKTMIELDGTETKSRLGANAMLSVSQAVAKAAAQSSRISPALYLRQYVSERNSPIEMPLPIFNLIEGGKHASNRLNFQEFLVIPASSKDFKVGMKMGIDLFQALKKQLLEQSFATTQADEGGFAPVLNSNMEALTVLKQTIDGTRYEFARDVFLGIDVAANSFEENKTYKIKDRTVPYPPQDLAEFYENLLKEFSLIYLEDPFGEDDIPGWKLLFSSIGDKLMIVGDDIVTTSSLRLQDALEKNILNAIIIKPNQVGTVTESLAVAEIAHYKNIKIIVSHRSGETMDDFIADFAIGIGADYIKFGAPSRERVAKYNRLLYLNDEIQNL